MDSMYDGNLLVWASNTIGTSTEAAGQTAAGATATINLGNGRVDGRLYVDVTAIEIADNDEKYSIALRGSQSASWATNHDLAHLILGAKEVLGGSVDSTTGRYWVPFSNEIKGTIYSHARLYAVGAGTLTTGLTFSAWLGK